MSDNELNICAAGGERRTLNVPVQQFAEGMLRELAEGRSVELLCRGNSMNPAFRDGRDRLVLSPLPGASGSILSGETEVPAQAEGTQGLHRGDVVLARTAGGRWVIHRVVALNPLTLNGDGNFYGSRELVPEGGVAAVLTAFVRKGRRGSTGDLRWRIYSAFWRFAGWCGIGNSNLRRLLLAVWRRCR